MNTFAPIVASLVLVVSVDAAKDEPKPREHRYDNGELVRLTIEGRKAYLIRPTGVIDPARRWIWVAPGYLALPNERGAVEHRMYVDRFLAAGFHVVGIDVGVTCGSPAGAEVFQKFYQHLTANEKLNPESAAARPEQWRPDLLCMGFSPPGSG